MEAIDNRTPSNEIEIRRINGQFYEDAKCLGTVRYDNGDLIDVKRAYIGAAGGSEWHTVCMGYSKDGTGKYISLDDRCKLCEYCIQNIIKHSAVRPRSV